MLSTAPFLVATAPRQTMSLILLQTRGSACSERRGNLGPMTHGSARHSWINLSSPARMRSCARGLAGVFWNGGSTLAAGFGPAEPPRLKGNDPVTFAEFQSGVAWRNCPHLMPRP